MRYAFYFGPSGSGKTTEAFLRLIRRSAEEPDRRFYIIAPEQYGMLLQKQFLLLHPAHASGNVEVMSFNRLAWRVFAELSVRVPDILDDTGKAMVLRKVAGDRAEELKLFRGKLKKAGFTEQVKSMVSELYQYGVTAEMLKKAEESPLSLTLRQKLKELRLIFEGFQSHIQDKGIPKEELLSVFSRVVPQSAILKDACFLFDGFTGFTPVQYRLIGQLMGCASELLFTVTTGAEQDPYGSPDRETLFRMSAEMTARITDLAGKNGGVHGEDVFLPRALRLAGSPSLVFLEKHLLRYDGEVFQGTPGEIFLRPAVSPAGEIRNAAEEIQRLVKTEGYRYREIAVVTADPASYEPLLAHEFALQGLPLYLDRNMDVAANPLSELLRSAMFCITDRFSDRSWLRFLKSGLVTEERELVWKTELYVRQCGIRGFQRFSSPWEYLPAWLKEEELGELNRFRERTMGLLLPLREAFTGGTASVAEVVGALKGLMEETGAAERLSLLREQFLQEGNAARAREYEEVFPEMNRVLTEMEELLPDERLNGQEMSGVLDAGIGEIRVGQIPAFADRISAGDLTRSRFGEVRALFLLGANDGMLPSLRAPGGLVTDREKEALRDLGIQLSPTAKEDLATQRYYLYRVLTSPGERLYLSYAAQDRGGKALRPAGILDHLKRLFPELSEGPLPDRFYSGVQAERALVKELRDARLMAEQDGAGAVETPLSLLLRGYRETGRGQARFLPLIDAASFSFGKRSLTEKTAESLYGKDISGSVTRIETYYSCPFRQFAQYGLRLKETQNFVFEPRDLGTLAHLSLQILFRKADTAGIFLPDLTEEQRLLLVEESAREAAAADGRGLYEGSARNRWMVRELVHTLETSSAVLTEQLRFSSYRPYAAEQRFDARFLRALAVPLSNGGRVLLTGKADRIDLAEAPDGRLAVKVVDYKTGSTRFDPAALLDGSQIQLLLYLEAAEELVRKQFPGREVVPGAVFYEPLADPYLKQSGIRTGEDAFRGILKELKPNGLLNPEEALLRLLAEEPARAAELFPLKEKKGILIPGDSGADTKRFGALKSHVRRKVREAGEAILSGSLEVSPLKDGNREACTYCPYRPVCRFDRKSGYHYRRAAKMKPQEAFAEIEAEENAALKSAAEDGTAETNAVETSAVETNAVETSADSQEKGGGHAGLDG